MSKTTLLIVSTFLLLLISTISVYLFYLKTANVPYSRLFKKNTLVIPSPTPLPTPNPNWKAPTEWKSFKADKLKLTIDIPRDIEPYITDDEKLVINLAGPAQLAEGDFYDGISITAYRDKIPSEGLYPSIQKVYEFRKVDAPGSKYGDLQEIQFANHNAYRFSEITSSEIIRTYVGFPNNEYLFIESTVADPNKKGLGEITDKIINSIALQ